VPFGDFRIPLGGSEEFLVGLTGPGQGRGVRVHPSMLPHGRSEPRSGWPAWRTCCGCMALPLSVAQWARVSCSAHLDGLGRPRGRRSSTDTDVTGPGRGELLEPLLLLDPDALPGNLTRDQHAVRQSPLLGQHGYAKDARSHSHSRLCSRTGVSGEISQWIGRGVRCSCVGTNHCARPATGKRRWLWPRHRPSHRGGWLS